MPTPNRTERRLHARTRVLLTVVVRPPGRPPVEVLATDLGEGGAFLLDDPGLKGVTRASFEVRTDDGLTASVRGELVRRQAPAPGRRMDPPGAGVAFAEADALALRPVLAALGAPAHFGRAA